MEKSSVVYKTPIGPLKLEATAEGICGVKFLFGKRSDSEQLSQTTGPGETLQPGDREASRAAMVARAQGTSEGSKAHDHLQVCQAWLDAYFAGTLLKSNPPIPKPPLVLPPTGG